MTDTSIMLPQMLYDGLPERCPVGVIAMSRCEARAVLQQAAEYPGSHRVASLYALALIDAEGGHYEQAVNHAQQALEASEAAEQPTSAFAPIVALIALLLSAR